MGIDNKDYLGPVPATCVNCGKKTMDWSRYKNQDWCSECRGPDPDEAAKSEASWRAFLRYIGAET